MNNRTERVVHSIINELRKRSGFDEVIGSLDEGTFHELQDALMEEVDLELGPEVERSDKPRVCIDFDGVIHSYTSGWQGEENCPDPPVQGAREAILEYLKAGWEVVIFSTRAATSEGRDAIWSYLVAAECLGLPHDLEEVSTLKVTCDKIPAKVYIDDRAYRFCGSWPTEHFLKELADFPGAHGRKASF